MAQIEVALGIGLAAGGIPPEFEERIEGLGDGFARAEVEGEVQRADMMVQVVAAKPGGEPHRVGVSVFPGREPLTSHDVARKQGLAPDFDVVAAHGVIVEPLNGGGIAAAYPVFDRLPLLRTDLFPSGANEGFGAQGNGLGDVTKAVDEIVEEF